MKEGYVFIGNNVFSTLLAVSELEQAKGLMGQKFPPPVMTFVYNTPKVNKFWMKNTPSPLDIIFCHNNKISQICYGEPYSTAIIGDNKLSDLVIELPHGTVDKSNIKYFQSAGLIAPTLEEIIKARLF